MKTAFSLSPLAALLLLSGCIAWAPAKPQPVVDSSAKYSLVLPAGWNHLKLGNVEMVSRYGPSLQQMRVVYTRHKGAFGSGKQKSDSSPDMDPRDIAAKVIADMKNTPNHETIEMTSIAPAMLGGRAGFRAELASKRTFQADAIRYKHILYGVAGTHGLYLIHYEAPVLYYFERNLPEVESSVQTFKLL
jgi:hypothetical protein